MKAKTKLQKRVAELSGKMPLITETQRLWAKKHCLSHKAFATKNRVVCMDCGVGFSKDSVRGRTAKCPSCSRRIVVETTMKRTDRQECYFGIASVVEDFQVVSIFELFATYKIGRPASISIRKVVEYWILPDATYEVIGRVHTVNFYQDAWGSDWSIRQKNMGKYHIAPLKYYPGSAIKKEYKKIGITHHLQGISFIKAINMIPNSSMAETLLKSNQFGLLELFAYEPNIERFWPSMRICIRNKYKPNDPTVWIDYLRTLEHLGKDIRSAHYVCPKNLKEEHDRYLRRRQNRQKLLDIEKMKVEIQEAEISYSRKIRPFVDLEFSEDNIVIKPLASVKEFEHEGYALQHCVFTNEYYNKADSLILSARIDGVPVKTIEVLLTDVKVVQSRGLHNNPSEFNERILNIINSNLGKIGDIASCRK